MKRTTDTGSSGYRQPDQRAAGAFSGRLLLSTAMCLAAIAALPSTAAADEYSRAISNNAWEQLTFPVYTSSYTIRDLLADDLPADGYGESWTIFTYDPVGGAYDTPSLDSVVPAGQGFWIIQRLQASVTLDVPPEAEQLLGQQSAACRSDNGCVPIPLSASGSGRTFHMLGSPFADALPTAGIAVTSSAGCPASTGCSLPDAASAGLVNQSLLYYSSASADYVTANSGAELPAWQGFWFASEPGSAGVQTQLLLPDTRQCTLVDA